MDWFCVKALFCLFYKGFSFLVWAMWVCVKALFDGLMIDRLNLGHTVSTVA